MPFVYIVALVGALGGLLFGYDWVVIGGAKPFFERFFRLSDEWHRGWANSCALLGCLVGAVVASGAILWRLGAHDRDVRRRLAAARKGAGSGLRKLDT